MANSNRKFFLICAATLLCALLLAPYLGIYQRFIGVDEMPLDPPLSGRSSRNSLDSGSRNTRPGDQKREDNEGSTLPPAKNTSKLSDIEDLLE